MCVKCWWNWVQRTDNVRTENNNNSSSINSNTNDALRNRDVDNNNGNNNSSIRNNKNDTFHNRDVDDKNSKKNSSFNNNINNAFHNRVVVGNNNSNTITQEVNNNLLEVFLSETVTYVQTILDEILFGDKRYEKQRTIEESANFQTKNIARQANRRSNR